MFFLADISCSARSFALSFYMSTTVYKAQDFTTRLLGGLSPSMASAEINMSLARSLPTQLQRFFALNPPRNLFSASQATASTTPNESQDPNTQVKVLKGKLNPFKPHKNPRTGKWHPPIYSLRRQAELVKLAQRNGVEDLLPESTKSTEYRNRRREDLGLRMKGIGVGQKVKGHIWERTLKDRLDKRRQAMLDMPQMIQTWKLVCYHSFIILMDILLTVLQRGHGRGWKRWPR